MMLGEEGFPYLLMAEVTAFPLRAWALEHIAKRKKKKNYKMRQSLRKQKIAQVLKYLLCEALAG